MRLIKALFLPLTLLLTSCSEIRTNDPIESFTYWSGTKPPAGIEVINAEYWQSGHWSREYRIYLKFRPTKTWWDAFMKRNSMVDYKGEWSIPENAPGWFRWPGRSLHYRSKEHNQGSLYLRDTLTGICYIYETQL